MPGPPRSYLTRHRTDEGPRWAFDGCLLPRGVDLGVLLAMPKHAMLSFLSAAATSERPAAAQTPLAPVDPSHEIWAAGVTYRRSREAREAESSVKDVYSRVYDAERPELFFKAVGSRAVGTGASIRIRRDSKWNVPEPELVLVVNSAQKIVGFTIGNDVSSRDIEGENPLYLPQAKIYEGSCGLGPGIELCDVERLAELEIRLVVTRKGEPVFAGETRIADMKRGLEELVVYLGQELEFPSGVLLFTGTGIVPPESFSLAEGDSVAIGIGALELSNPVTCARLRPAGS